MLRIYLINGSSLTTMIRWYSEIDVQIVIQVRIKGKINQYYSICLEPFK